MLQLLIPAVTGLLQEIIPDTDKRDELAHKIATMAESHAHEEVKAQLEVNKVEAAHKSLLVAGWRPGAGWVCVVALLMNYLVLPTVAMFGVEVQPYDTETMMPLLLGMLGLGGARTVEKWRGVSRER